MNTLNKITIKNLKLNKTRTLVALLGIILAVGLISAVVGLGSSLHKTMVATTIQDTGDYHIKYKELDSDSLDKIITNKKNDYYYYVKEVGLAPVKTTNNMKKFVRIVEYDDKTIKYNHVKIKEGRLPKNDNEVVVQKSMYDYDFDKKIGDTITVSINPLKDLDLNKIMELNNLSEDELNKILKEENTKSIEELENKYLNNYNISDGKEYKIVGIIYDLGYEIDEFSTPTYTVITYNNNISNPTEVYVKYKSVLDTLKNTCSIVTDSKDDYNKCIKSSDGFVATKNYQLNESLLNLYGIGVSAETKKFIILSILALLGVISICCIIIIKNSFNISVTERYKQYGMLSSIGTTKSQLKRNVLFEGLLEGIIAIPFGILFGMLVTKGLVLSSNKLLFEAFGGSSTMQFSMPLLAILVIIIVSAITILISCLVPAIKISKISPIEAIRNNNEIKIKKKKLKPNRIIKKIFGIGGVLADKSLKRSRKKYRTIVISVTISVILFIVISTGTNVLKKEVERMYKQINFNVTIIANDPDSSKAKSTLPIFKDIAKHNSVSRYAYEYILHDVFVNRDNLTDKYKEFMDNDEDYVNVPISIINDSEFSKISNNADVLEGAIIHNKFEDTDDVEYDMYKSKIVNIMYADNKKIDIKIVGDVDVDKTIIRNYVDGVLFISESYANKYPDLYKYGSLSNMNIYSKDSKALEKYVAETYKESEVMAANMDELFKAEERIILIMNIFVYTFIVIITLISITNIFNTISTNMMLRKKEFAMLRAMGMTDEEFNRMIFLESMLYALKALLYGLVISFILLYYIINLNSKASFASKLGSLFSSLPYLNIIIAILVVTLVILSTMIYSIKKINKQNVIETIRNDNI